MFCLATSNQGGTLVSLGQTWPVSLGVCFFLLCTTALVVSLSHLSWAIKDITRSSEKLSWCMAIAVDLGLIGCELVVVLGSPDWITWSIMAGVTVSSMVLNVWAFLCHE